MKVDHTADKSLGWCFDRKCYRKFEFVIIFRGGLDKAVELFNKAIDLSRSEAEMAHLYSLLDAATAQAKVAQRLGIQLPSMMWTGSTAKRSCSSLWFSVFLLSLLCLKSRSLRLDHTWQICDFINLLDWCYCYYVIKNINWTNNFVQLMLKVKYIWNCLRFNMPCKEFDSLPYLLFSWFC